MTTRAADLGAVLVAGAVVTLALGAAGLPSPALFAGLAVGLARALALPRRTGIPAPVGTAVQVVLGVMVGTLVQLDTVAALGRNWLPVLLVTAATLVLSLLAGQLMALREGVSRVTGAFSMVAGGASGITVMARDLGADERMVAVLQYLRVLLIVLTLPTVAAVVFSAESGAPPAVADAGGAPWWGDLAFVVGCGVAGTAAATLLRIPVASLLGPMLLAAGLDLGGLSGGAEVPPPLIEVALLLIGLQVGLEFTRASLRTVGRALPVALVVIVVLIGACAGLGMALAEAAGVSALDGYLATTPGGMSAVLATATTTGADTTFVMAVQVLRLFVMLLSAPLIARFLRSY